MKHNPHKCLWLLSLLLILPAISFSQGGMWMPSQLKRQEPDMQKLGLKIPVSDIYSDTGNSLNNAVVIFGTGCTGEMVSANGLLFTNHHCGYGTVQSLSTPEKNYLINGFWAMNQSGEIPCPGLTVKFVRKSEDVTRQVLANVRDTMDETLRNQRIADNISYIEKGYTRVTGMQAEVKSYYNGNQYFVELKEIFRDVRLVAFPPNGIGVFGGDTDNWMWPQMKGDFSVFRVYANKNNKPADYNINNVPYHPKRFFHISTGGYKEDDLVMVYGFPYITEEYISSFQLNQVQNISYPIRIATRGIKLGIWDESMKNDPNVFLKYASKYSLLSNGYKKWQGALKGLQLNDVLSLKKKEEEKFQKPATMDSSIADADLLLPQIQATVTGYDQTLKATEYYNETVMGIEAISMAGTLQKLLNIYRTDLQLGKLADTLRKIKMNTEGFYKNYDAATDKKVFEALMPIYVNQPSDIAPAQLQQLLKDAAGNYSTWADIVYENAATTSAGKLNRYLDAPNPSDTNEIKNDPAYKIYHIVTEFRKNNITPKAMAFSNRMHRLDRLYLNRVLAYNTSEKNYYPDANQSLRLTYGPVKGIKSIGSNMYSFQTNIDQEMARYNPQSTEFNIPQGLRNIYSVRDFGRWQENGTVPVNFISINHTSGGNSGSPAINARGELIGLNFDRIWDGTMSDNYFDPRLSRNVMVDVRYVLFIIEKYGHAGWLLKEMKLEK